MADGNITVEVSTHATQAELRRLRVENAALKRDLQYARDGLTKGRTRMREDVTRLQAEVGQVERPVRPRTCSTCAHRSGSIGFFGRCMLSGYYIETERKFPSVCGADFRGWQQREPLLRRVQAWLYAA